MRDILMATIVLGLPLLTLWLLHRRAPRVARWLSPVFAVMALLAALLIAAQFTCAGGIDAPFASCALPGSAPLFNALRGAMFANITLSLLICPLGLILLGIGALVGREKHDS